MLILSEGWRRAGLKAVQASPNPKPEYRRPKETRGPKSEWAEERLLKSGVIFFDRV